MITPKTPGSNETIKSRRSGEHYLWGDQCDAWILAQSDALLLIEEEMPPGASETRHYHEQSTQIFYVLSGTLSMEMDGTLLSLQRGESLKIAPKTPHTAKNTSTEPVTFLVISAPTSRGDRIESLKDQRRHSRMNCASCISG